MNVFITGGTGFIGSEVVKNLLASGHRVIGLARSEQSENALKAAGADVVRGSVTDLEVLREASASADGVMHLAYDSDFGRYEAAAADDLAAVKTVGAALAGTDKPFVVTSGTLMAAAEGRVATEDIPGTAGMPRGDVENEAIALAGQGVRVSVVRLAPCVHSTQKHGLVSLLLPIALEKRISAYPDDGARRWPAVHMQDAAKLFCKALELAPAGTRLHAVSEEGIRQKDIAEAIGEALGIPVVSLFGQEAEQHFGWAASALMLDNPTSSAITREQMDWHPGQRTLIEDIQAYLSRDSRR